MTTAPNTPKPLTPQDLASQLFDLMLPRVNGDPRETARQVIFFLREALVYAVSASATDVTARAALLKNVGESIVALTAPPASASPPAAKP